jgi:uncharacterized protein (TIGR00725 family)
VAAHFYQYGTLTNAETKTMSNPVVTVFGSARPAPGEPEYVLAYDVGAALAEAGYIVCNGGYAGTMEASARGAKDAGGQTIGIITDEFPLRKANLWIDTVITVDTMIARMLALVKHGDAYVALKGGTGTLLELATVWEFMNKGLLQPKPTIIVGSFWEDVVRTVREELSAEGRGEAARYVTAVGSAEECVDRIRRALAQRPAEPAPQAGQLRGTAAAFQGRTGKR